MFQQGGGGKKKNKKAKAPKEINYSHYCDVCDRGFQSDEELKSHIAEHVKVMSEIRSGQVRGQACQNGLIIEQV